MHFLLTGASGRVGSHTLKYLLSLPEKHTVLATDLKPLHEGIDLPEGSSFVKADLSIVEDVDRVFTAGRGKGKTLANETNDDGETSPSPPFDGIIHLSAIPSHNIVEDRLCHNINVTSSYNVMYTAAKLGVKRIVQASSVNATGLVYSDGERRGEGFRELREGLPLREEDTPFLPEDPYSLSKHICEMQAEALTRSFPSIRISSLRFHHVCPPTFAIQRATYRDLWSWTSLDAAAEACYLGVVADKEDFQKGHEAFYILWDRLNVGEEMIELEYHEDVREKLKGLDLRTVGSKKMVELLYPGVKIREGWLSDTDEGDRRGLFDTGKAERLLGWRHTGGEPIHGAEKVYKW